MDSRQGTMGSALGNGRRALMEEVPVGYKRTEVGVIPEDWDVASLGEMAKIATGGTPPTHDSTYYGDEYPFVSPVDLGEAKYVTHTEKGLSKKGFAISRRFPAESILFVSIGSTIGKCGIASVELTSNQQINAILPSPSFSVGYLYYTICSAAPRIKALAGEQAVPIVNKTQLSETLIALAPKPEQRVIAEALSDVDGLLAALEALIAKKRAVKQAAMQQLLTGKSRLPGFSGAWETKRIGALFEAKAGGDVDPTRSSDVQSDSHPYPIYANSLSQEGLYGFCSYAENCPGSITVTARGTLGKAFYRDTPFVAIGRLLVLEPKVRMDARFFSSYINHSIHFAVESTGVPQLTAPQVARYSLLVPLEHEQRAISETLSDMDAEIAALERRRDKTRVVKQGMMQQLLTGRVRLVEPEV